jgi:hypothetical protein
LDRGIVKAFFKTLLSKIRLIKSNIRVASLLRNAYPNNIVSLKEKADGEKDHS